MNQITEIQRCKLCGCPVRIVRRADGSADHYEAIAKEVIADMDTPPIPAHLAEFLRSSRKGLDTVAIVGSAWTTRGWAPYGEKGVEVWCFNEMHGQTGVGKADRWFQLHPKSEFTKAHRFNHKEWLESEHDFVIYMQRQYDGIPDSNRYPLSEIQDKLLTRMWKGEEQIKKVFGSSMAYAVALALYEGFERIELFGIEMALEGEWAFQRESMAFWVGLAAGMGVEIWMPEECKLFYMPLYAYEELRKGDGSFVEIERDV
jgi:hypothetical protein